MSLDRFMNILLAIVIASFASYVVSGVLHSIWIMWSR